MYLFFLTQNTLLQWTDCLVTENCLILLTGCLLGGGFGLLRQQDGLDVGQDSSLSNGNTSQKFVQFLIVPDGQLQVPGNDSGFLVVSGGITSEFENLSCEIFHHSGQINLLGEKEQINNPTLKYT